MKRVIIFAMLFLVAMTGTAQAKGDNPAAACKHGGYVNYVNPATGEAFTTQRQCVKFVRKGGTLEPVPVVYPVTIAGATTTGNAGPVGDPDGNSLCSGTRVNLLGYGTHTVVLSAEGIPGYVEPFTQTYADVFFADGFASFLVGDAVDGQPITVTVDGEEIGTATPDC